MPPPDRIAAGRAPYSPTKARATAAGARSVTSALSADSYEGRGSEAQSWQEQVPKKFVLHTIERRRGPRPKVRLAAALK